MLPVAAVDSIFKRCQRLCPLTAVMSSFTCRRASASDATAVRTFIQQQRLAGVRYSDPQPAYSDHSQPSSAPSSHSTSSLFAVRSASNDFHLRAVWGCADPTPLLASQWLTAVVADGEELICVACFHFQPNQKSVDGIARSAPPGSGCGSGSGGSGSGLRGWQARDWPAWLPNSLQSVSPSSTVVTSFHPSACRFLTFFACCTISNSRSERALVDCLLSFVFQCDTAIKQLITLRPHNDPMSPMEATPLSLCFKVLEEPSAAMSTASSRPSSVGASDGSLLTCWRVLRSSLWPTLTVRRGRLEDHDDLLPLFAQRQHAFLPLAVLSPPSQSSLSPLSLLSSTSCVSLVAECAGRAVGLLCLTCEVDTARLSEQFEVAQMSEPGDSHGQPWHSQQQTQGGWEALLSDDWSDVTRLPSGVLHHLRQCYTALLAAGGICSLSPPSRSTSLSVDGSQQQQQQQTHTSHTSGIDRQALLQLLMATSTAAVQCDTDQSLDAHSAMELASTLQGWAGSVDSVDGCGNSTRLASESEFVRLCCDCVSRVHSRGSDSEFVAATVGRWMDCLESKMPAAALQHLRDIRHQPRSDGSEEVSEDRVSESSAFAVSCFVLANEHSQQAEEFIPAAFAALPQRHWMLLSAPYDSPHMTITAHMTQLQPQLHHQHEATQAVYALHRYTAMSALSHLASVGVRRAEQSDMSALTTLLYAQAATEYELPALLSAAARDCVSHAARLSALASASSAVRVEVARVRRYVEAASAACIIVTCAGECVGMVRAQPLHSTQQLHALQAHYQATHTSALAHSQYLDAGAADGAAGESIARHLFIRSFVLHPLFACHTRLVLQESMRLCEAQALHYTVGTEEHEERSRGSGDRSSGKIRPAGSFNAALLRCMHQRAPLVVPAAAIAQQDKCEALHMPAGAVSGGSSHNAAGLPIVDEAAGTERLHRTGHENDTAVTPGPPLSLTHLHLTSGAQQLKQSTSGVATPGGCSACNSLACPTFALHTVSPPLLSMSRVLVSQRVVFIGASATSLSALSSLLTAHSAIYFTSLTLISLQPLTALSGRYSAQLSASLTAVPSSDIHVEGDMLQRVCLAARVQLVTGRVVDIDGARQLVTVRLTAAQHATSHTLLVPYDELIVASGTQPNTHSLNQQLTTNQSTVAASGPPRMDGKSGTVQQSVEGVTASTVPLPPPRQQRSHHGATVSALSSSQLPLPDSSAVDGVWPLSSLEHSVAFLASSMPQLVPSSSAVSSPPSSAPAIVVSGASLSALTVICTLLSLGVSGDCICWVHPCFNLTHPSGPPSSAGLLSDPSSSLSVAVLGDELPLMAAVLNTLADERIRIVQRATVSGMHVRSTHTSSGGGSHNTTAGDDDNTSDGAMYSSHRLSSGGEADASSAPASSSSARVLQSVVLSSGDVLACSVLVLCSSAEVDSAVLDVCVSRLGLVHDGRFVVDEHFRSATLPNVRLAGPLAKFQRDLLQTATSAAAATGSSTASGLGVQLLDHAFYSSAAVGRALATELCAAALQQQSEQQSSQPQPVLQPLPGQSGASLFSSLHDVSCVRRAVLPGPVAYFHTWSPAYSLHPSTASERVLTQSFTSYTFSLHICTHTLRIVRIRYWGAFELTAAHNLTRLIGLPVTYCNRLLWRWESGQIRSLLTFLQQDWAQVLYSHAFSHFRHQLVSRLAEVYAGQLTPILDRLTDFQRSVWVDQQRRHEQQQLQHQRRSSNIKSALLQPTQQHTSTAASDAVDVSALQALNAYLPAQFRDVTHRAVLTFVLIQHHSLPASLHHTMPVRGGR